MKEMANAHPFAPVGPSLLCGTSARGPEGSQPHLLLPMLASPQPTHVTPGLSPVKFLHIELALSWSLLSGDSDLLQGHTDLNSELGSTSF